MHGSIDYGEDTNTHKHQILPLQFPEYVCVVYDEEDDSLVYTSSYATSYREHGSVYARKQRGGGGPRLPGRCSVRGGVGSRRRRLLFLSPKITPS